MPVNKLILGDNLEIMRTFESESVDLIYLDPPFFSNRNYEVIWGDEGEVRSFQDRWAGGIDHYIAWLKERVEQMHRILRPTGSIFLHCDWHANAYIRVFILDEVFGENNFVNEIIWQKIRTTKAQSKQFGNVHDIIYFYSKSNNWLFENQYKGFDKKYIDSHYKIDEKTGKQYRTVSMLQQGQGSAKRFGDKLLEPPAGRHWIWSQERIDQAMKDGLIRFTSNGRPEKIQFLEDMRGDIVDDMWEDIIPVNSQAKERIGYPTQKPEKLLQRIIECASNEGDTILDPFVGGGTTVAVAEKLNRTWIGIDQSVQAIKVTELRLGKQRDLFSAPFYIQLHKYDYDTLRYSNAFEFESWIVQQFGGTSNTKQRGDFGLDGKMPDNTPIQVKRSDNVGRNVIDNFFAAVQRSDKKLFDKNVASRNPAGYIIAFSFGKGAVEEVARLKLKENIIIELVTVDKIVPIAKKPAITVEINELARDAKGIREIEFIASGQSEAGIEFYSWDFEYSAEKGFRASVIIDKAGKQLVKLKAGQHSVAVKVVDNDGLESLETLRLTVNGTVERTG